MANGSDDPKELEKRLVEARIVQAESVPDVLSRQEAGLRGLGGGFGRAVALEDQFLGLAEDFVDPDAQARRFQAVREQLLGDRARRGLFGATGDEAVSIQGLAALDDLRRQDIAFGKDLQQTSFFNPATALRGAAGQEGLLGTAASNNQFSANLAFNRRIARDTARQQRNAGYGAITGAIVGGLATESVQGAQIGASAGAAFGAAVT